MLRSFAINTVADRVNLDSARRGSTSVTVTNSTAKPLRAWPELKELGSTKKDWLALEGGGEKSFSPNEAQTFKVTVTVPNEAAPGRYEFKLNMISGTKGTEEESTEGPVVGFEVAQPPAPKPSPKVWLYIVLGVILLGGIVVGVVLLLPSKVAVPTLVGKSFLDASNALHVASLTNTVKLEHTTTNLAGTVLNQDQKPKSKVSKGTAILLTVESGAPLPPPTTVPNFAGQNWTLGQAIPAANRANVLLNPLDRRVFNAKQSGRIVDQKPIAGTSVLQGTEVTVWVGNTNPFHLILKDPVSKVLLLENQTAVKRLIVPLGTHRPGGQ